MSQFYLLFTTADYDYDTSLYTVSFTAGQMNATLMVPTMDDSTTELSEDFVVVIISTGAAEVGPYDMAFITINDNDPGTYIHAIHIRNQHAHSVHEYVYNSSVGGYD